MPTQKGVGAQVGSDLTDIERPAFLCHYTNHKNTTGKHFSLLCTSVSEEEIKLLTPGSDVLILFTDVIYECS